MKKFLYFISGSIVTLILIFIFLGSPLGILSLIWATESADRWVDRNIGSMNSNFTIAQQEYAMPSELFNVSRDGLAVISHSIILPDFQPKRLATKEELDKAENNNNLGHIFILPAEKEFKERDLRLIHYTNRNEAEAKYVGEFDHLEHYKIHSITSGGKMSAVTNKEVFVTPSKDNISEIIRCYKAESDKPKWCEHHFLNRGLLYSIRYRKTHLNNHQNIKNNLISHIDSYRVN